MCKCSKFFMLAVLFGNAERREDVESDSKIVEPRVSPVGKTRTCHSSQFPYSKWIEVEPFH